MGNEILNMINDRKNKDFFVQMHPLRVKLSIEEKIYYLNGIKYLAGEDNEKINDFLVMIAESFNISEDMYNDEDINLMEEGLGVLNSMDVKAKMILLMDGKIINSSKNIMDLLQIDELVVKNIDYLFNMIIEKNNEKIVDFFEENEDFSLKDYMYLIEYFDIDLSGVQKEKELDKIAQLDALEEELKGIYKSMSLSKDYIKRELDKHLNTRIWRSSYLSKNLPNYIKEEGSFEDYDDAEDYFEDNLYDFKRWHKQEVKACYSNVDNAIKHVSGIINSEYNSKKQILNNLFLKNEILKGKDFKFKSFNINFNKDKDLDINSYIENPFPRLKVRSQMKKKMWSKERYVVFRVKITAVSEYKEFGRNAIDKIWNTTAEKVLINLSDFVNNEIERISEFINELKLKITDNSDVNIEFMEITSLDIEEAVKYIEALALVVGVDNEVTENEKKYLLDLAKKLGVDTNDFLNFKNMDKDKVIDGFKALFLNNIAKNNFILDAYKISLLDGEIKKENQELIDYFVKILEVGKNEGEKIREIARG